MIAINIVLLRLKSYSSQNNFLDFCVFYTDLEFYEDDLDYCSILVRSKRRMKLRAFLDKTSTFLQDLNKQSESHVSYYHHAYTVLQAQIRRTLSHLSGDKSGSKSLYKG